MRSAVLGLGILLLTTGFCVAADEGKATSPQLEDLAWLIGDWQGDYLLPDGFPELGPAGAKVVTTNSFQWILGKKFMTLKIHDKIKGNPASTGHEVIGWDNSAGKLGHWFFGSKGFHGSGHWSRAGDVWSLKWKSIESDGNRYEGVSEHVQQDADTFTWQMRDLKENGKPIPDWPKVTYRRMRAAASDEDGLWQAFRKAAVGTWSGTGELIQDLPELAIKEGEQYKMRFSLESDMDGMALVGKTQFEMLDNPFRAQCRVLAGWDPAARKIRFLAVWSGGLVEEIALQRKQGSAFFGTYTAKSPAKPTLQARIRLDFPTSDSYVFTILDGPHKGKELSSWKRAE